VSELYIDRCIYISPLKLNQINKYTDKISTIKTGYVRIVDNNIKWVRIVLGNGTRRTTILEKNI
jgi:O-phosphoseryl-tRNA(Cys) synthetase